MASHCKDPACYCLDVHPLSIRHKPGGKAHVLGNKGPIEEAVTGGEEWPGSRDTER